MLGKEFDDLSLNEKLEMLSKIPSKMTTVMDDGVILSCSVDFKPRDLNDVELIARVLKGIL